MNQPAREMSDRPNGHIGLKTSATLGDVGRTATGGH